MVFFPRILLFEVGGLPALLLQENHGRIHILHVHEMGEMAKDCSLT